ncbi:MAG: MATE family efflux transporter [Bryobacterales bacterium]|nr:MATE family efflux transporter [Bryobacterales bacterium]
MAVSEPARPAQGIIGLVRESLSGSDQDYTTGDLGRSILLLAIPMILEMLMESLFGIVDAFFVSGLGTQAVAAVALTEAILTIIFGVAIGLSMAATAMVARRMGEKDQGGASIAAVQAIWIGIFCAVPVALGGLIYAPELLRLMGGDEHVIRTGTIYTRTILGGCVTVFLLFLNNAIFRGAGDAAIAMRALWISNLINIILNPCLIRGWGPFPELGLLGSAVGTTIGRGCGVAFQFWVLFGGMSRLTVNRSQIGVDFPVLWKLARVSATGIAQFLVSTASWLGLVRIIALSGAAALAGYMLALRMVIFIILPAWGLCNAAATMVGQSLGAGKPDRAEKAVYAAGRYNMAFLMTVALGFIFGAEHLLRIFSSDPEVIRYGVACLRYVSYGYGFYAWGMVTVQAFNGAGDTTTPTLINLACQWALQIPLAWALSSGLGLGATGVFAAMTISESVLALIGLWAFRRGSWKEQKI